MKSPFPGMDPYLERHWGDVHHSLIQYARDALQSRLPDDLRARMDERVYLESEEGQRRIVPDVQISEVSAWSGRGAGMTVAGGVAVAEPVVVQLVEITEGTVEIRERGGGRVVTVIEFLSPGNKTGGAGTREYLKKQDQVLLSPTSLVEIDLVRAGRYRLAAPEENVSDSFLRQALGCISPGWDRGCFELYPMPLRQRLPVLPIPLREGEPRVPLDLQALLDQAYLTGRYDDLDYTAALATPLAAEDAAWVRELLAAK